jgi:hypothetical protein
MTELDQAHEYGLQVIGSMEEPEDDYLMTAEEWWAEFFDNACCPTPSIAAARMCGCRGSAELPSGISRLLTAHLEDH